MNQDLVFENRPGDIARTPLSVEGALPEGLRGTFLLIGPGRTELNSQRLHLLDGYGRIVAATLGPAGAELRGRHVQTKALADDLSAGSCLGIGRPNAIAGVAQRLAGDAISLVRALPPNWLSGRSR